MPGISPNPVRGLGLCPFETSLSELRLVCDVLARQSLTVVSCFAKGALQNSSISVIILTSTAWRTHGRLGAFPTPVGGHRSLGGTTFLGSHG